MGKGGEITFLIGEGGRMIIVLEWGLGAKKMNGDLDVKK